MDLSYSQTLENRSSDPPNPPAGLGGAVFVVEDTGAALAQPPKSSSSVTEGAGGLDAVGEAPQPAPTSLAVSVSGSFIIEEG